MAVETERKESTVRTDTDSSSDFRYEAKPVYSFFKRAFDIIVSFICIVFLLIPFAIISLIAIL